MSSKKSEGESDDLFTLEFYERINSKISKTSNAHRLMLISRIKLIYEDVIIALRYQT